MSVSSGPTIRHDSGYTINVYTESGTFIPNFTGTVEVLVVGGGGGGGMDMGGGGGGGGVISNTAYSVTKGTPVTVTVGLGGKGGPAGNTMTTFGQGPSHQFTLSATSGGNSVFGSLTAIGGGFGGSSYYGYTPNYGLGAAGGSGGGSSGYTAGATTTGGAGTAGQGNKGGNAGGGSYYSGGGGGAGAVGVDGPSVPHGGNGIMNSILGPNYYWGAGGGGAAYSGGSGGNGGKGGGGGGATGTGGAGGTDGLNSGKPGTAGSNNSQCNVPGGDAGEHTGSGGGGGSHYNWNNQGGSGGSGIVIVKYLTSTAAGTQGGSNSSGLVYSVDAGNSKSYTPAGNNIWRDLSGSANVSTLVNGPTYSSLNGGSLVFNGSNQWADINNMSLLAGTTAFTISAFYNCTIQGVIIGNYGGGYTTNSIWFFSGGLFLNNSSLYIPSNATRTLGKHHLCVTRSVTGYCNAYLDGVLEVANVLNSASISANINWRIAADVATNGECFGGNLYSVQVYNRELSAAEVKQSFNTTRGRLGI